MNGPILLFDGDCAFCNGSVKFVLARDPKGSIAFAPLQSTVGGELLSSVGMPSDYKDGVVFIEPDGKASTKSTAAVRLVRYLRFPWPLLAVFVVVPRFLRDWAYDVFANRRYRWFGMADGCMLPTPELRSRTLA